MQISRAAKILILVLLGGLSYLGWNVMESRKRVSADTISSRSLRAQMREGIARMVERAHANDNWANSLSAGSRVRIQPVLAVDLEPLWLSGRPILFSGSLVTARSGREGTYRLTVARSELDGPTLVTPLSLNVECSKSIVDPVLAARRDAKQSHSVLDRVYVIARVESLQELPNEDKELPPGITGNGTCVDMMYVGSQYLANANSAWR